MDVKKFSYSATPEQEGVEKCYAAYLKCKPSITFEEWSKIQKCYHCGVKGHVWPQSKQYLADRASGKVPSLPNNNRSPTPSDCSKNIHRNKFNKDPKLKALLSAFATFAASYIMDNDNKGENENATQDDKDANNEDNKN